MSSHIVIDARIRRSSTGRYVDRLLEHLQKTNDSNKYTILVGPNDPWKSSSKKFKTVVCKYKQFSFSPIEQIGFAWQLYRLKPDLVHFTMTQQPILYFGKNVTTTHDLTMLNYAKPGRLPKWVHALRMRAYRFLLWQSHRKAKVILVPTEYVQDAVKKYHLFVGRKTVVTLEASEAPLKSDSKKPEIGELNDFILYVGSAFPHKNLRKLIKSFQIVKKSNPDLKLVLAGKREYYSKRLEKWAARKELTDGLVFTGFVEDPELKWLYENALIYVFPSLSEGFGLPGLEAMAHGCPVVSSNATCLPEVYGEAAGYFDPLKVEEMAKAINKVLKNDDLRKELIKNGEKQVKKYSWQKMANETLEVYNQTLNTH